MPKCVPAATRTDALFAAWPIAGSLSLRRCSDIAPSTIDSAGLHDGLCSLLAYCSQQLLDKRWGVLLVQEGCPKGGVVALTSNWPTTRILFPTAPKRRHGPEDSARFRGLHGST